MRSAFANPVYVGAREKTFLNALGELLQREFPGQFGPAVTRLFAERVEALFFEFFPQKSRLQVGQMLWLGVAKEDLPHYGKSMRQTRFRPVVLSLITPQDIEAAINGQAGVSHRRNVVARILREADAQNAVLSEADLGLMMSVHQATISREVRTYEKEHNVILPRRGTVHDIGRSVSHKSQIVQKALGERKPTAQVARETHHDVQSVEEYVRMARRIKLCLQMGLSAAETAFVVQAGNQTVKEYELLIKDLGLLVEGVNVAADSSVSNPAPRNP